MLSLAVAVETLILGSRDSGMGISKALGMVLDMFLRISQQMQLSIGL